MPMRGRALTTCILIPILSLVLAACNLQSASGVTVWLDVPLDGLSFPAIQEIKIEGHASGPARVRQVEIWINGALLTNLYDPHADGDLTSFHTSWRPAGVGTYTIQA